MNKYTLFIVLSLLACSIAKPIIANKVIIALNCGSKDQEVDSMDKVVKYKPVPVA